MWPWEHLAVGYVAASLLTRVGSRPLDDREVALLAVGTQAPDLVDKPLAWAVGVLASGTALAHSVFVALPLCAVLLVVTHRRGQPRWAVAYSLGHLLHLPGDVFYGTITRGDPPAVAAVLWPLARASTPREPTGLLTETLYYLGEYRAFLGTPRALLYVAFEVTLLGLALFLWVRDGRPGPGLILEWRRAR